MWWIINVAGLIVFWHFTDLKSESVIQSAICPLLVAVFLIGIAIKVVIALGPSSGRGSDGGGGFFGGFDGGGDGGCSGGNS